VSRRGASAPVCPSPLTRALSPCSCVRNKKSDTNTTTTAQARTCAAQRAQTNQKPFYFRRIHFIVSACLHLQYRPSAQQNISFFISCAVRRLLSNVAYYILSILFVSKQHPSAHQRGTQAGCFVSSSSQNIHKKHIINGNPQVLPFKGLPRKRVAQM
jgi:hypothetical protein